VSARFREKPRPERLVLVRYKDHAHYLNSTPATKAKPVVREVVGWVYEDDPHFLYVVYDRDCDGRGRISGITLFREGIIEVKDLSA
jgi:hypothetical protein